MDTYLHSTIIHQMYKIKLEHLWRYLGHYVWMPLQLLFVHK